MNEIYLAVINKDDESGHYEITFPDIKNTYSWIDKKECIHDQAEDLLAAVLSCLELTEFPVASTITDIQKNLKEGEFIRAIILNYKIMEEYRKSARMKPIDDEDSSKSRPTVIYTLMSNERRRAHYDNIFKLIRRT